ncbi:hypothetical protein H9P43_002092 [Blastocladiella emersonii ATCC 22665]|nr:hypothetical protein H9P43_002092 [Blastocladiella emersonii ATCC 22665]
MTKIDAFPVQGLLPKDETEASAFITKNPEYDGRNSVIAILDTGVDPTAPGMQVTSDGKPKIIDIVDATGAGDVSMGKPVKAEPHADDALTLVGATGRRLVLSDKWTVPSGTYRVGLLRGFSLFGPVLGRVTRERKAEFAVQHARIEAGLQAELAAADGDAAKKEAQDRIDALKALADKYDDAGPVYDVVAFYDGTHWRVVVDTNESGDLRDQPALASYRFEGQYHRFGVVDNLAFSVNVYDNADTVSIVTLSGSHGTHVAAIAAANFPEEPALNGIAPGAQIVSIRIGDTRLGSMETGAALSRAVLAMVQNKVDLCNISYGEASHVSDTGRFIELLREQAVRRHGVIVVSSAGNAGPALTTVGAPGGTTEGVISVGAHVGHNQMAAEYALVNNNVPERAYTWSSRGPTYDGDWGVDVYSPGSAITAVPTYQLAKLQLMNGTSMSSPNACGNLALLVSGWKKEVAGKKLNSYRILKAIQATGTPVETDPFKRPFIQTDKAFTHLIAHKDAVDQDVNFRVSIGDAKARGVYLRGYAETHRPYAATATVAAEFPLPAVKPDWADQYFVDLETAPELTVPEPSDDARDALNNAKLSLDLRLALIPSHPWIRAPAFAHMTADGRSLPLEVDAHLLTPGLHAGYVAAWDTTNKAKGALFTIPVTVCKPHAVPAEGAAAIAFKEVPTSAGRIERKFIAVPEHATFADIVVRAAPAPGNPATTGSGTTSAIYLVRTLQLAPQNRYPDHGQTYKFALRTNEPDVFEAKRQRVLPGITMELCLAQWWSSASSHVVDVEVVFHGVEVTVPAPLVQGDAVSRIEIASHLGSENAVTVGLTVDNLRKFIRPASAVISPLSATRDLTPDTRQVYQLVHTYNVKLDAAASVTPRFPGIGNVLYDAPYDAFLVLIHDAAQRLLATHDIYAKSIKLDKGDYTVRVQIRHDAVAVLEKLRDLPLALDFPAPKGASVDLYTTYADAVTRGSKLGKLTLTRGDRRVAFAVLPADVKDAKPGDLLVGSVALTEGTKGKIDGGFGAFAVAITNGPAAKEKKSSSSSSSDKSDAEPKPTLAEQIRDLQIAHLKTLKDDESARAALAAELAAAHPAHLPLLDALLELAPAADHAAVLAAADAVIAAIDRKDVAGDLALTAHEADKPSATRKAAEARKASLVAALLKRAHALLAAHGADHADFAAALAEYKQWALPADKQDSVPSLELLQLVVPQLVAQGHVGAALKVANKFVADTALTSGNVDTVKKALAIRKDLVAQLGWKVYADNEDKWVALRNPNAFAPF